MIERGSTVPSSMPSRFDIEPAAMLQKLEVVRIFDYGLTGVVAPERPTPGRH